ncbi:MAG: tandem-95 repeat protein [Sphingobacteriales bacterium]|nr:tandem-95 repeat protein [Sphingobacteriales bacterium]
MIIKFQSLIYQQQPYIRLLAIFLFWIGILHNQNAVAATETVPVGSFIVNMGVVPQTVANGLKPYGMLHQLLREQNVPIKWVINPTKSKDGVDFTYNGTAFKGGPFIIYANYRTPAVNAIIASWQAQGVVGVTTTSPVDVPVYNTINYYMNWTLNSTNSSIAQAFLQNAGIPSSNWNFVAPSELTCCNDIFVMPHADPTWATHQRLLSWNDECDGAIWAGCHAVSVLENIINPSNPAQTMNFLMSNGATPGQAAVLFGDHDDGSPPYQYGHSAQPVMQFMGTIDAATQNGSEQIYLPQVSWRPTTMVGVWDDSQADVPSVSPGVAAVLAFGQGLGDDNRGRVMYEGGHNIGGTSAASVAAQRAFFNFSFWASQSKAINVAINVPSSMSVGTAYTVSATATGGAGAPYIYEWISTCGGTFANPTAATTTFTPNASSTGCIISCKVRDNCGSRVGFGSQSVSSPQPPVANNDNATIGTQCGQGGSTTINILSNDSDGDTPLGDLTITLSGNGANGTFVLNPNGTVTYTANVNFSGTDQVQYQICDPTGFCDNALISVTVGAADINGCLPNQTYAIASSGAADSLHTTTSVTGTLTDVLDQPDGLTVEMDNNGDVLILGFPETINAGDTLTLYLKRGDNTNPTTLTIESSLNGTSGFSTPTTIGITTTGVLPYIYIVPSGGLNFVRLKRTAGKPNIDAITYEIWDCVNAAPTLGNDQGLALEDFPVQIQVLGNDQDPLGQALSISRIITQPTNGLVSLNPNGTIDYQPNNDYSGTDSFVYEACNTSGLCSQATVNIQITDDGCPAGQTRPSTGTEVSTTLTIADDSYIQKDKATTNYGNVNKFVVGEKDNNIRRSLIRFDLSTIPSGAIITSAQLKLNRITGTKAQVIDVHALTESWTESLVTWNKKDAANWTTAGGSYNPTAAASVNMGTTTGFKYWGITSLVQSWVNTPANNFGVLLKRQAETNKDKHEFASSENTTVANRPALVVTYLQLAPCEAIGNRPPLAQPDFATTNSVTPTTITVKANDTDPDNNTLTVTSLISPPSSGTAVLTGSQTFTYTPTSGFNGKTSFTYRICDNGSPIKCDTAKVTITVTNAPPTAVNDNGLTLNANSDITVNVQGNDSDPEGQALTTTIVTQPLNGSAVLVGNSIKYIPNPGFSGADVLTYSICEPASGGCNATTLCSTALVNLTVNNQPPIANNDTKNVNACQPTYIDVLVNDSDPENGPLTVSVLTQPVHGTATVVGAQILYTPTPGYAGPTDGFTYQICDDASPSLCTPATVSITFNTTPVNNTPVATDDIDHTVANVTAFVQVLSNDNDPDGDELAVTVGGSLLAPTNGTVSVLPNKQIAYVPASGFTGTDVFEYQICDVHDNNALCVPIPSLCDIAQVTITVENQPPVAVDDQAFTGINIPVFIPVLPNDFDPEGNTISVTSGGTNGTNLQTTQGGTITISGNGFNYTPPTGYTGTDVFQYVICDNGNPSECATAQVTIYITPPIDLEVTKTVSPANATAGSNVVFTITVNNTSTTNATGVVVKDLLPSSYTYVSDNGAGFYNSATGIWFIGNLNASATRTLNITATVVDYANANVAEVSDADQYDIDSSPNNYNGLPNEDDEGTAKVNCVALSITPTPNNPNCVASNGYITLSISNGVSPFSFEWTSGTNSGIGTGTTVGGLEREITALRSPIIWDA